MYLIIVATKLSAGNFKFNFWYEENLNYVEPVTNSTNTTNTTNSSNSSDT
jgi:hypothetical protein